MAESRKEQFITAAEVLADKVLRYGKNILPHIARLFLVSTFIEDGIRMWMQWEGQRDYIDQSWKCGWFISSMFVFYNFIGQIGGCILVLVRRYISVACGLLLGVVASQTVAYSILWDLRFLMKNLALVGGLGLILAETKAEGRSLFAGLPSMGNANKQRKLLQLAGRILLILMFLSVVKIGYSPMRILQNTVGGALVILIVIGYKTKLASLVLFFWLTTSNLYVNTWWSVSDDASLHDFLKYDFFQTLSVAGGLLLVIALGPGGYSMDEKKKSW